jgi:hypothetical protein
MYLGEAAAIHHPPAASYFSIFLRNLNYLSNHAKHVHALPFRASILKVVFIVAGPQCED